MANKLATQQPSIFDESEADAAVRATGLNSLRIGILAIQELADALGGELGKPFEQAVLTILRTNGRVIVSGIGKSGHIGRKIAATLASTGTLAFFVHPGEASHGDLGMIARDDTVLAISWSGETSELGDLTAFTRRFSIPLIAITWNPASTLGRAADVLLALPRVRESCPHDLAPTSSSLIQLAIGDALAVALLARRGFTPSHFRTLHPGGNLAARLKVVAQLMHVGEEVPLVQIHTIMADALLAIAGRRYGCVGVIDEAGKLVGIVTDGDLRRHIGSHLLAMAVEDVMTASPLVIESSLLASAALDLMNRQRVTALFVVEQEKPIGILHVHDLLRAGIV